jgi:uncharacterized protein YndB with AHSA1/START domain
MITLRVERVIGATIERVWADIAELESHVEWMHDALALRFITDNHAGVGTTFECDTAVGPLRLTDVMTVTEWDRPHRMGIEHIGAAHGVGTFWLIAASATTTRFVWVERISLPIWLGGFIAEPVARPILRAIWRRNLDLLAARFEPPAEQSHPVH